MKDSSIRIVDLGRENVDDVLNVCTLPSIREDRNIKIGCGIRKEWLMDLYRRIGSCAKIAYAGEKPVGVIQYTPLHIIPYFRTKRKEAIYIHCIYVQDKHRKQGVGSLLLEALINEMSKPNKLFGQAPCRMFVTSARRVYGFTQVGFFKFKGFRRVKGSADVGLILPLSDSAADTKLDIPALRPRILREHGAKIFFKPTCQYCKHTNERIIKAEIRKVNEKLTIEEYNLWNSSDEAIRRRITCVATYINGKPILPMSPQKFLGTIRHLASEPNDET